MARTLLQQHSVSLAWRLDREMCGSRKYPYPTTEGISLRTPLPPWIFHICKELMNPTPLRKFHRIRRRLRLHNGFHLILLHSLELEHSKLPTKQPKLQNIAYPLHERDKVVSVGLP